MFVYSLVLRNKRCRSVSQNEAHLFKTNSDIEHL